jgi:hypothetical protein
MKHSDVHLQFPEQTYTLNAMNRRACHWHVITRCSELCCEGLGGRSNEPLTRPATAGESAVAGHPLPTGEGYVSGLSTGGVQLKMWDMLGPEGEGSMAIALTQGHSQTSPNVVCDASRG